MCHTSDSHLFIFVRATISRSWCGQRLLVHWEFTTWMDVEFCQMLSVHELFWQYDFPSLGFWYRNLYWLIYKSTDPLYLPYRNENFDMHIKNFKWLFIAAVFIIATNCKSRYPSTSKWINGLRYILTMKYYSAIKRNKLSIQISTASC